MTRDRVVSMAAVLLMALLLSTGLVQAREREPGDDRGRDGRAHPPAAAVLLHAPLVGTEQFPAAHGRARYAERGGERRLQLQIEDVRLPAGTVLTVLIDGQPIGRLTLNRAHKGRLTLKTTHGDTLPEIAEGATVGLVGPADERVAAGRFTSVMRGG